jgi:hypothetical protein
MKRLELANPPEFIVAGSIRAKTPLLQPHLGAVSHSCSIIIGAQTTSPHSTHTPSASLATNDVTSMLAAPQEQMSIRIASSDWIFLLAQMLSFKNGIGHWESEMDHSGSRNSIIVRD